MSLGIFFGIYLLAVPPAEALTQNADLWVRQLRSDLVDLRILALKKLAEIREPSTQRSIVDALDDPSAEVRYQAMRALTRMPNAETLAGLQSHANSETDPYLVSELRRSIQSIEDSMKAAQEKAEKANLKAAEKEIKAKEPKKKKR